MKSSDPCDDGPTGQVLAAQDHAGESQTSAIPTADRYVGRLLEGLPVVKGDKVRVLLFGSRTRDFQVVDTSPDGTVLISTSTQIKIEGEETKGEERQRPAVSYEDIGGLDKEIQRIREMVELPLKHPEVFDRLGIDLPKAFCFTDHRGPVRH